MSNSSCKATGDGVSHQSGISHSQRGKKRKVSEAFERIDAMGSADPKIPLFKNERKSAKRGKLGEGEPMIT